MSCGIMVCSVCRREIHQDGPKNGRHTWRHCNTKSAICYDACPDWAAVGEPRDEFCGADKCPDQPSR